MKLIVSLIFVLIFLSVVSLASSLEIKFWHSFSKNSPRAKVLENLIEKFNKQQYKIGDKTIIVKSVYKGATGKYSNPYNFLFSELLKAAYNKDLPNLSISYENWVSQFKEIDIIKDFDSFNSQKVKDYFDSLYPDFKRSAIIDGKIYSLPFNKSIFAFYYNSDYVDSLPTNFQQFISKLEEIKFKTGKTPLYLEANEDTFIILYLLSVSDDFFRIKEKIYPTFLGGNLNKATQLIENLEKRGLIQWTENSYKEFISNKAPIFLATTSRYTDLRARSSKYIISPLPADQGKIYAAGTNLVIFKSSPEEELASLKFVEYLLDSKNLEYFCMNTGYILPTSKHTENYSQFLNSNLDYKRVIEYSKDKLYVQPAVWAWENIRDFFKDYMISIFLNKQSVEAQQKEMEQKVNQIISNQNAKFNN